MYYQIQTVHGIYLFQADRPEQAEHDADRIGLPGNVVQYLTEADLRNHNLDPTKSVQRWPDPKRWPL